MWETTVADLSLCEINLLQKSNVSGIKQELNMHL